MRSMQSSCGDLGPYPGGSGAGDNSNYYSDLSQNQLTIKTDKNLKKKYLSY
jgi:hypothetical protein